MILNTYEIEMDNLLTLYNLYSDKINTKNMENFFIN
jgi:hypothetical protein